MSDVSHGVNASKTSNGAITPVSVDTGVYKYTSRTDKSRRTATEEHQRADKRCHSHGK